MKINAQCCIELSVLNPSAYGLFERLSVCIYKVIEGGLFATLNKSTESTEAVRTTERGQEAVLQAVPPPHNNSSSD